MEIYLICFLVTIIAAFINEKIVKMKRRDIFLSMLTGAMVILPPAIIAGLRDFSVGIDVNLYVKPVFDYASNVAFPYELFKISSISDIEPGFRIFAYIISRFTNNAHWFLFAISFLIGSCVYYSLLVLRQKCSIMIGQVIYLLMFYHESYNLVRQYIAVSITLVAITFLIRKKIKLYFIFTVLAISFHTTAVLGLVCFLIYKYIGEKNIENEIVIGRWNIRTPKLRTDNRNNRIRIILLCLILLFIVVFFSKIIYSLIRLGLVSTRYELYMSSEDTGSYFKPTFFYIFSYFFLFVKQNRRKETYWLALAVIDSFLYLLRWQMGYLHRVAVYFCIARIISFSKAFSNYKFFDNRSIHMEDVSLIFSIISTVAYFYFNVVYWNIGNVIPYSSAILGVNG